MIYRGHDIRFERGHVVVLDLKTGVRFSADTYKEAKEEIDLLLEIRKNMEEDHAKSL